MGDPRPKATRTRLQKIGLNGTPFKARPVSRW